MNRLEIPPLPRQAYFDPDDQLVIRYFGDDIEFFVTYRELCKLVQLTGLPDESTLPGMANEYGNELRRIRLEKGISLRRLARDLGVSAAYISDVERGNRLPLPEDSTAKALKILKAKSEILTFHAVLGRVRAKHPEASESTIRKIAKLIMQDSGGT